MSIQVIFLKIFFCLTSLNCLVLNSLASDVPIFWCKVREDGYCVFSNINLTEEHHRFTPTSEAPTFVKKITFENSKIPILTDDLCRAFPNLEYINMGMIDTEVQEVHENAFYNCTNLKWLRLTNNKIKKIYKDTFRQSSKLEYLYLGINQIQELDDSTFLSLTELKAIYLDTNYLGEFKVEWFANSKKIQQLRLECNDLPELNEGAILNAFPLLNHIGYSNNELSCARVEKINKAFQEKGIFLYVKFNERRRYYEMEKLDEVTCLPDKSWSAAYFRRANDEKDVSTIKESDNGQLVRLENEIEDLKQKISEINQKINTLVDMFKSK